MTKRFPLPAALTAVASVLLGVADVLVALRVRAPDTPGEIVMFLILLTGAAQVVPLLASIAGGLYVREATSPRRAGIAIAVSLVVGLPVFALGLLGLFGG